MVGKLTGEVVTKEELYEAAWATDCGLSMSKYAEAYQINRSSADCLQRKFLTALARVLFPEIQAFFESEEGQREFAEWKAKQQAEQENKTYTPASFIPLKYQRDFFCK